MSFTRNLYFFIKITVFFTLITTCNLFAGKIYYGTAVTIDRETISSGTDAAYYGSIIHTANRGSIIIPEITDMKGNVVVHGTVIMQQGTKYIKAMHEADEASFEAAKHDMETAKINLERFNHLAHAKAESIEKYQSYIKNYYNAVGTYIEDSGNLKMSEEFLETRTFRAPFEGFVNNVYYLGAGSRAAGNPVTLQVVQLNPIGIKIKMDRENARKINSQTPITVYLPNSDKTQGVYNGYSVLCNDGIIILTVNHLKPFGITDNKKIKAIFNILYPVDYFFINNPSKKTLCIPEKTIQKDDKGYFVWKAKDRKFFIAGDSFNPVFQVLKIYITPGNLERIIYGDIPGRSLQNPGQLQYGDVVIPIPPKDLKEGDTVVYISRKYQIMPGETIKVEIGK